MGPSGASMPFPGWLAPLAHRQIGPAEGVGVELIFQHLLGVGVAGHHQQAGGPPVQPVDRVEVPRFSLLIVIIEQDNYQLYRNSAPDRDGPDTPGALFSTTRSPSS